MPKKKRAKVVVDEVDAAIVRNLDKLCQHQSSSATDEDELFGRKKAMAKSRIQNLLMDIEFPVIVTEHNISLILQHNHMF